MAGPFAHRNGWDDLRSRLKFRQYILPMTRTMHIDYDDAFLLSTGMPFESSPLQGELVTARIPFLSAALCNIGVAILHIYVILQGPWAYRYFGAGEELAKMAEQGSYLPMLLTSFITLVFAIFALYCLAGAGWDLRLPFLRFSLVGIATMFTLRGSLLLAAAALGMKVSSFDLWSSVVSLAIGLLHCAAVWLYFCAPPPKARFPH